MVVRENWRTVLAMLSATTTGIVAAFVSILARPDAGRASGSVLSLLTGWIAFSGVHAVLSWAAYRNRSGEDLRRILAADPGVRDTEASLARKLLLMSGTHSFAFSAAVMALFGIMVLVVFPELRRDALLLGVGAGLVAASWVDVSITYAVHYARVDLNRGGLEFPGEDASAFSDYQYFSRGVQTTFATTDVTVTTTEMRTVVSRHGLLAFTFNSVIVALLVSLVLTLR